MDLTNVSNLAGEVIDITVESFQGLKISSVKAAYAKEYIEDDRPLSLISFIDVGPRQADISADNRSESVLVVDKSHWAPLVELIISSIEL